MMKIDWKSKLTSRKFWAAVVGFVTAILIACKIDSLTIEQVTAVITAGGVLIAYIIGEGMVDAARLKNSTTEQAEPLVSQIGFSLEDDNDADF